MSGGGDRFPAGGPRGGGVYNGAPPGRPGLAAGLTEGALDPYLSFIALVSLLFFLPKILSRLRLPSPVTEGLIGVGMGPLGFSLAEDSDLLRALAGLGISALFLFAGLEVEIPELLERRRPILQHLLIQVFLFLLAALAGWLVGAPLPVSVLAGVAVVSPSAGFIVPALEAFGLSPDNASWIKQKAIATELVAILTVLVFANSGSNADLLRGLGGAALLLAALPALFALYHVTIQRWAPNTELPFVMVVALAAASLTHHLGVHYLVGAFVVGLAARRYLDWGAAHNVPLASIRSALAALRFFSAFFVPFFFYRVGLCLPREAVGTKALLFLAGLILVAVPIRTGAVLLHRRLAVGDTWAAARDVALFLGPTMVFSIATAEILRQRFFVEDWIYGGLVLYGVATSFLPLLTRKVTSTEYEDVLEVGEREFPTGRRSG